MARTKKAPTKVTPPSDAAPLPDGLMVAKVSVTGRAGIEATEAKDGKPATDAVPAKEVVLSLVAPVLNGAGVMAFSKYVKDVLKEKDGAEYIARCVLAHRANRLFGIIKSTFADPKNPTDAELDTAAKDSLTYAIPAPRTRMLDEVTEKVSSFEDFLRSKGGKASAADIAAWAKSAGIN